MNQDGACMALPPGYRFHPMDEEIITHYLWEKVLDNGFSARAIGEVDLNKCEPWDLPSKAKMGESEWYFFCQRDRKYPTGMRTNRATEIGYWKATGKDKEIYKGRGNLVGMKKTLVFYMGRAPKGEKTNWVMHEYRLDGNCSYPNPAAKNEWVVCKVFHKNIGVLKRTYDETNTLVRTNSFSFNSSMVDELLIESPTLPPLVDTTNHLNNIGSTSTQPFSSFNHYDHQGGVNTQNLMGPNLNLYSQTSFDSYMGNMDFNLHQDKNSCFNQCYSDLENLWKG